MLPTAPTDCATAQMFCHCQSSRKSDDAEAGDAEAGDAKAGDAKAGDAKAGDAKAGDAKAGDAKAGDAKAGDAKAGDEKAGDAKAECTAGTIGLVDGVGESVCFGATHAAAICGEKEPPYSKTLANELLRGLVLCGDNRSARA